MVVYNAYLVSYRLQSTTYRKVVRVKVVRVLEYSQRDDCTCLEESIGCEAIVRMASKCSGNDSIYSRDDLSLRLDCHHQRLVFGGEPLCLLRCLLSNVHVFI